MRPRIELVGSILRANVRAYAALGVPVCAVVKNDGYRWGAARVAREIDALVESYIVSDEAEFWALRMHTRRPIRLLASVPPARLAELCAHGGTPNVTTAAELAAIAAYAQAVDRPVTIRVGIIDTAGWTGIAAADASAFAAHCAARRLRVELWTHITSTIRADELLQTFTRCAGIFRAAGVAVASVDIASTGSACAARAGDRIRIGAGLFGARLGGDVTTTCAIRVAAPAVQWFAPGSLRWAGYGDVAVPVNRGVSVLRCGYGDGLPKKLAGADDILSVGMQYTTCLADNPTSEQALIDQRTDLDFLAHRLDVGPHELITGLAQQT